MDAIRVFTVLLPNLLALLYLQGVTSHGVQPLAMIAVHVVALEARAFINVTPSLLGLNGENKEWITVEYGMPNPSGDDWIGVFSSGNFSGNHERDWPDTGSFYGNMDSGSGCGVLSQNMFYDICMNKEQCFYKSTLNDTIHVVAGGGGAGRPAYQILPTYRLRAWSLFKDYDYGLVKLTAFDHSNMLFEYKKSSDGKVYESFRISRDYRDILACTVDSCPSTTLST